MLRDCFASENKSRRLSVRGGDSTTGPRLGGRPPVGVVPKNKGLSYLITLPWSEELEVSLFVDADADFIFSSAASVPSGPPHYELIRHEPRPRGESGAYDSELSEHPILIGDLVDDAGELDFDGVRQPYSDHKIGGRPYFLQGEPELEDAVAALLADGFGHAIQLGFPGSPGVDVRGTWPFGDGLFHVLVREVRDGDGLEWRCFCEM